MKSWAFSHKRACAIVAVSIMLMLIDIVEGTLSHMAYGVGVFAVGVLDALADL